MKTKGYNSDSDEITYSDVKDIADYAIDSVKWAYCAGIMTGDENGKFNQSQTRVNKPRRHL